MRPHETAFLALLVALVAGCAPVSVESRTRPGGDPSNYATIYVEPVLSARSAPTGAGAADFEAGDELDEEMRSQSEKLLSAKGYRLDGREEADLRVQIETSRQIAARRVWSSDPDANYYVTREVADAVVILHVLVRGEADEIWQGEARSRLPERELIIGPSAEEIWMNVLAEAIDRFPPRSIPRD